MHLLQMQSNAGQVALAAQNRGRGICDVREADFWTGIASGYARNRQESNRYGKRSWRLCVRRDRGRQGELKSCASPGGAGGPQEAAMRFNDRPADG
jgi:hypothetical protein